MTAAATANIATVTAKQPLPPRKRARTAEEKEQRRQERVLRNRRAAHASREKKRRHVEHLEQYVAALEQALEANRRTFDSLHAKLGNDPAFVYQTVDKPTNLEIQKEQQQSPQEDDDEDVEADAMDDLAPNATKSAELDVSLGVLSPPATNPEAFLFKLPPPSSSSEQQEEYTPLFSASQTSTHSLELLGQETEEDPLSGLFDSVHPAVMYRVLMKCPSVCVCACVK